VTEQTFKTEVVYDEPIKVIRDIIQTEMALDEEQIVIYNQKYNIPKFEGIFMALGIRGDTIVSVKSWFETETLKEWFEAAIITPIQVDIMSRNGEARIRRLEPLLYLRGIYAQNMCEKNCLKIAKIPTNFDNVEDVESPARLNRYTFTINVNSVFQISKTGQYYDKFVNPPLLADQIPIR